MGKKGLNVAALPASVVDPVADAIFAHYKAKYSVEPQRPYLGASVIGKSCSRSLWYGFRWAKAPTFSGRLYRLFQSGHLQEPRVVADLTAIGCSVWAVDPSTGQQWSFVEPSCGGHVKGNCDGILQGLPQAPKAPHVLEVKTSSEKMFNEMKAKGVEASKPEHFAQMQIYMRWTQDMFGADGCHRALYVVVNKNDDSIYTERVEFDKDKAQALIDKAHAIVTAAEPPQGISTDSSWYECKFCDYHALCFGTEVAAATCRSCAHATPEMDGDGRWSCSRHQADIPTEAQRIGCNGHRFIPVLLSRVGEAVDSDGDSITYRMKDGREFTNGDPAANPTHVSSAEIAACADKAMLPEQANDPFILDMRRNFGGRLVA